MGPGFDAKGEPRQAAASSGDWQDELELAGVVPAWAPKSISPASIPIAFLLTLGATFLPRPPHSVSSFNIQILSSCSSDVSTYIHHISNETHQGLSQCFTDHVVYLYVRGAHRSPTVPGIFHKGNRPSFSRSKKTSSATVYSE